MKDLSNFFKIGMGYVAAKDLWILAVILAACAAAIDIYVEDHP